MFALILVTLLLSVRGSTADTDESVGRRTTCYGHHLCITFDEEEITAEAGLCAVIPCSFTTPYFDYFRPALRWLKCEQSKPRCDDSETILCIENICKSESEFKGRVSLLEPDVSQENCGIIINDLKESDSGSYQLRVNEGFVFGGINGFIFDQRTTVSVKDLTQKPTVMVPALTAGQQTTLTCTAPGLCSGSEPKITWTWRGAGESDSHITGNITAFKTENLTAVTQRHSSTLTFNTSAEHHGTSVTCKVSFTNNITTEETVTLNVTLFPKVLKISGCEVQMEVLRCVCVAEGLPLPSIKWPLLKSHTEYFVTTSVSNHTVKSTITLTVKDHSSNAVECVSSSEVGEVQQNISIVTSKKQDAPVQHCGPHSAVLPWAVAAVSLIVNVIFIICVMVLRNKRKKEKPNQEDRTYMSLRKTELSPEYDVIGQPKN